MATSRGATPADPTLAATTDDNSRGGLFVRSNIANPVQGVDVSGVQINNSTINITLTFDDGSPSQTRTFTLNQSETGNLEFDIPIPTTQGGGGGGEEIHVSGGTVNPEGTELTLTLNNNATVTPIDLTNLASQTELDNVSTSIPRTFHELTDTPTEAELDAGNGMVLGVDTNGNIVLVPAPPATVSTNSFSSTDTSVLIEANGAQVNLEAQPTWTGNDLRGSVTGNVQVTRLVLDRATGFRLRDDGNGVYTITTPEAGPTPASAPTLREIPPTSALEESPRVVETITAVDGTFENAGDVGATLRSPDNTPITIDPPAFTPGDSTATVTIPAGTTNEVGDYTLTVTTTTTPTDTREMPRMDTTTRMIDRFYPVLRSRAEITASNVNSAISTPPVEFGGTITAIAGSGVLYFAVPSTVTALTSSTVSADTNRGYPVRVGFVGTISVPLPGSSDTVTYNQFRAPVPAGVELISFS